MLGEVGSARCHHTWTWTCVLGAHCRFRLEARGCGVFISLKYVDNKKITKKYTDTGASGEHIPESFARFGICLKGAPCGHAVRRQQEAQLILVREVKGR